MADALSNLKFGGGDLYIKVNESTPAKLRVISTDPYIHNDKFGNTRYAFTVWSHDNNKPMILDKGISIAKGIQQLHNDDDYGNDITQMDVKLSAVGEGKDTRYSLNVLPKTVKLEEGHIEEAKALDLAKIIKNGIYASEYNEGKEIPVTQQEPELGDDDLPPNFR